jgi:hypothetical protein
VKARGEPNTPIAVVPNLRHAMISSEDITCLIVSVELGYKQFRFANDIIDDVDVVYVFLVSDLGI